MEEKHFVGLPIDTEIPRVCEESPQKIYYHYTSLEKMWKILSGEELWATQAGFSNDNEELLKGIEVIRDIFKGVSWVDKELIDYSENVSLSMLDSYIICFCEKDDKLSQWRAYCRDGGVSLGFAFDQSHPQYFLSDVDEKKQTPKFCKLYPVYYLTNNTNSGNLNSITKRDLGHKILSVIQNLNDIQSKRQAVLDLIPYIKHAGFCEEEEHRLLIKNPLNYGKPYTEYKLDSVIQYADKSVPSPYVKVNFNNPICCTNTRVLCNTENEFYKISDLIKQKIEKYNGICDDKLSTEVEYVHINDSKSQIIIGRQKQEKQRDLFNIVDGINKTTKFNGTVLPIWCDGHLPIRSITVAPSLDQRRIIDAIKHQCEHKYYWMRYVEVKGSDIPYRSY